MGLCGQSNDDREQRMLECERQELNYAYKVGTNKPDGIVTKSYTVIRTDAAGQHGTRGEADRERTVRENKQAKVVKGNLRNRAATYATAIWQDYRRLSAFTSTASKNPISGAAQYVSRWLSYIASRKIASTRMSPRG